MKFIKKNIKLIIGIMIGMLLVSGISVYATYTYFATDVSYTKDGEEISVADALNYLYSKGIGNLELIGVVNGGRNGGGTASSVTLSLNVSSGKYVVIIADARRNNGSQGNTYNTTSQLGTLSGCSNYNLLVYTVNGAYYESSTSRANLWTNVYECTLEDEGTITYAIASNNDDHNSTMLVFKK